MLRLFPVLTVVLMIGPVFAGLIGTALPAFGYLPALGGTGVSFDPWRELLAQPGLSISVRLSLQTGLLATGISFAAVMLFCAAWQGTRIFAVMERLLSPVLSVPHATAAFGLAFLIAPSGWIARALAPIAGWDRPPDILTLQDPWALALIAGLVIKEIPFLLLMTLAALPQADAKRRCDVAHSLGYGRVSGWMKTVLPGIYGQIRLPVLAVLAYSCSVVDMAMILGPTTPAPLAVRILGWLADPDLSRRFLASAAAIAQLGLVVLAVAVWMAGEWLMIAFGRRWLENGGRGPRGGTERLVRFLAAGLFGVAAGAVVSGLAGLAIWSIAGYWAFPDFLPDGLSMRLWSREGQTIFDDLGNTLLIAVCAVLVALFLVLGCLQNEIVPHHHRGGIWRRLATGGRLYQIGHRPQSQQQPQPQTASDFRPHGRGRGGRAVQWLIYLPLLMPQISFMFGLEVFFTWAGLGRSLCAVVLAHLVFVLPYVFLSLGDPFRALDPRYGQIALCLGASQARVFWRVRLPILLRAVMTAFAVGLAVSVGQYLPTLLIGAGRFGTVTTEAVALAAGGDWRMIGIFGLLQMVVPFAGFVLALCVPAVLFRNRQAMGGHIAPHRDGRGRTR